MKTKEPPVEALPFRVVADRRLDQALAEALDPMQYSSAEWPWPNVVYVVKDGNGVVTYIGHSTNLKQRLWVAQRRAGAVLVDLYQGDETLERRLIEWYLPYRNKHFSVATRRRLWKKSFERQLLAALDDLRDWHAVGGAWVISHNPDWWPVFDDTPRLVECNSTLRRRRRR